MLTRNKNEASGGLGKNNLDMRNQKGETENLRELVKDGVLCKTLSLCLSKTQKGQDLK